MRRYPGADMVMICSSEEMGFLRKPFRFRYFSGATDEDQEGLWSLEVDRRK